MRRTFIHDGAGYGLNRPASLFARIVAWLLIAAALSAFPCSAEDRITVCVLDSGCNLEGTEGWNYMNDSADIADDLGHGTQICAMLAACAPDARIVNAQVLRF